MMTQHVVSNDDLGMVNRRRWEIERRMMEGTLDPSFVARNFQLTAEGVSLQPAVTIPAIVSPFFANEEVASDLVYPTGYAVKPMCEQLIPLVPHFPKLNPDPILSCAKELPQLPVGAEGAFVIPKWQKVAATYNDATEMVLFALAKTRILNNWRQGKLGQKYLKLSERTERAHQMLDQKYPGDYLLIFAQLGLTWRGRSVRKVRVNYAPHEFGLGPYETGIILISHPERLSGNSGELCMDCPGGEYAPPEANGRFSGAPYFGGRDGELHFGTGSVDGPCSDFGYASGLLPQ
ncbi:MAG: hypothetical protein HYT37_00620 [Candidatus Sungbacteria bacterium]|nr:hypothetical protein [Candidatus Sungbacteria bacterium]